MAELQAAGHTRLQELQVREQELTRKRDLVVHQLEEERAAMEVQLPGPASFDVEGPEPMNTSPPSGLWAGLPMKKKAAVVGLPAAAIVLLVVVVAINAASPKPGHGNLPPPAPAPRTRNVIKCQSQSTNCLPGINDVAWGFDIVYGKQAMQAAPILQLTYNKNSTYSSAVDKSLVWDIPDQFLVEDGSLLELTASSTVAYSAHQMGSSMSRGLSLGVGVTGPEAGLSLSSAVQTAASSLNQWKSYSSFAYSTLFGVAYKVTLERMPDLHPGFTTSLLSLPQNYTPATRTKFFRFFGRYGTHYVRSAYFGGYARMTSSVSRSSSQQMTSDQIAAQASLHMNYMLVQGGASISGASQDAASWFTADQSTQFDLTWYGGVPNLEGTWDEWRQWVNSYYTHPVLVYKADSETALSSTLDLIPPHLGGNSTDHIKSNLQRALQDYYQQFPYPADPLCMEQVLTAQGACCPQDKPNSCSYDASTCYDNRQSTCCGQRVQDLQSQGCCNGQLFENSEFYCCNGDRLALNGDTCCSVGGQSFICDLESGPYCGCNWGYCSDFNCNCCNDGNNCCQNGCCSILGQSSFCPDQSWCPPVIR